MFESTFYFRNRINIKYTGFCNIKKWDAKSVGESVLSLGLRVFKDSQCPRIKNEINCMPTYLQYVNLNKHC